MRQLSILALAALSSGCTGWLWGANDFGQLGNGGNTLTYVVPTQEASASDWLSLKAGRSYTCGVKEDQSLWCWGRNVSGQVGNGIFGSGEQETSPVEVGAGNTWASVYPGYNHTCAIDTNARLWCWGLNSDGQLGQGDTTRRTTPTQVGTASNWRHVALMYRATCAIDKTDDMYCFGRNNQGQLGVGDTTDRLTPTPVAGDWRVVDGGLSHACAITTTERMRCWGRNAEGQLGDSTNSQRNSPTAIYMYLASQGVAPEFIGPIAWKAVTAGDSHTCGIREYAGEGELELYSNLSCWGDNDWGKVIPSPNSVSQTEYVRIQDESWRNLFGPGWTRISAGRDHNCGIQAATLKCWGRNDDGQRGDGTTEYNYEPAGAAISTDWVEVSAGGDHTVGTRAPD